MLSVRLPEALEARLDLLAKRTGRSKSYYVREAVIEHIDEIEDIYLAEEVLERLRTGQERLVSAGEIWRGLDD